jgi:hypothetical protein
MPTFVFQHIDIALAIHRNAMEKLKLTKISTRSPLKRMSKLPLDLSRTSTVTDFYLVHAEILAADRARKQAVLLA